MKAAYRRIAGAAIVALCGIAGAPAQADQQLLCVLVPHFKDEYWLSVAHGLEQRSAEQGLSVRFFEAGGYDALANQIEQIGACTDLEPGAILIGAVSSDAPELLAAVQEAAETQPVIGLVNELHSDALAARVGVDWFDMGLVLGRHLAARFPADGAVREAVLLSGPPASGWVAPLERGLHRGIEGSSVAIVATYGADTGTSQQLRLVEMAWAAHPGIELMIGSAPAIEAAMGLFAGRPDRPELAATYVSHSVARGLVGRQILAAPFDNPIQQGRAAVDATVATMEGNPPPGRVSTQIVIYGMGISPDRIELSPADYFPSLD